MGVSLSSCSTSDLNFYAYEDRGVVVFHSVGFKPAARNFTMHRHERGTRVRQGHEIPADACEINFASNAAAAFMMEQVRKGTQQETNTSDLSRIWATRALRMYFMCLSPTGCSYIRIYSTSIIHMMFFLFPQTCQRCRSDATWQREQISWPGQC